MQRLINPIDRERLWPSDAELLLGVLMNHATPEQRGILMAEVPGAYRRYVNNQRRRWEDPMILNVYLQEREESH